MDVVNEWGAENFPGSNFNRFVVSGASKVDIPPVFLWIKEFDKYSETHFLRQIRIWDYLTFKTTIATKNYTILYLCQTKATLALKMSGCNSEIPFNWG